MRTSLLKWKSKIQAICGAKCLKCNLRLDSEPREPERDRLVPFQSLP